VGSFARCDRFGRVAESPWFVYFSIDGRWVDTDDYDQHRMGGSCGIRVFLNDMIDDEHGLSSRSTIMISPGDKEGTSRLMATERLTMLNFPVLEIILEDPTSTPLIDQQSSRR